MIQARLSMLGLYKADDSILDFLHLPSVIDAEELKKRLLIETAELEVLYPDPEFFKEAIDNYSALRLHAWEVMASVLHVTDYDPFTNVNRHEERTEVETRDLSGSADNTSTGKIAGFNVSTFQNQNQVINEGESTDTGTITHEMTYDLTGDSAISDTQDLIEKEMELRRRYDLYKIIINDIKYNFCLMVY